MGDWGQGRQADPAPAPPAAAVPAAAPAGNGLTATPSLAGVSGSAYGLSTEFAADNPVRMPSASDSSLLAAAKIRRDMMARSGRDSTRLVGTQVYGNTFLGSVG